MNSVRVCSYVLAASAALLLSACNTDGDPAGPPTFAPGALAIDAEPEALNAGWQLTGPAPFAIASAGDSLVAGLQPGEYTLTWSPVFDMVAPTPNPVTFRVLSGETTSIAGTYVPSLFPDTPAKLMANFLAAYENRDAVAYSDLLHPDFLMLLQPTTTQQYPDLGATIDLAEETRIHQRMFSGAPLTDPEGYHVPSVAAIDFQVLEQQTAWTTSTELLIPDTGDVDHPVQQALYDVIADIDRGQAYATLRMRGRMVFYITSRDSLHEGQSRTFYTLRGQKDLTDDTLKAVEYIAWGHLKALFR